ncbi:hypothetical protein F4778DRAFT_56239 [Xylariomycetidae sp. FL2044]|nr:hypothetical protein F4778DRAFT_56239 [Xylariomycetidae sp. FL2044]
MNEASPTASRSTTPGLPRPWGLPAMTWGHQFFSSQKRYPSEVPPSPRPSTPVTAIHSASMSVFGNLTLVTLLDSEVLGDPTRHTLMWGPVRDRLTSCYPTCSNGSLDTRRCIGSGLRDPTGRAEATTHAFLDLLVGVTRGGSSPLPSAAHDHYISLKAPPYMSITIPSRVPNHSIYLPILLICLP